MKTEGNFTSQMQQQQRGDLCVYLCVFVCGCAAGAWQRNKGALER